MKQTIQTYSVVVGDKCDAHCPFCISRLTPKFQNRISMQNFINGARLALMFGSSTMMITGKGEPTQNISIVFKLLDELMVNDLHFPIIELQTNGMYLNKIYLKELHRAGLGLVSLSAVSVNNDENKKIYSKDFIDLESNIERLHQAGISVRLSIVMIKNHIDTIEKVIELIDFCKKNKVEQLTIRPVEVLDSNALNVFKVDECNLKDIVKHVETNSIQLLDLVHGGKVYDYNGQNICLANCMTESKPSDADVRQLIYCQDGHLRYSWQHKGAIVL